MTFEAYKIAVKISLVNHVSAGLLGMSRDFAKTDAQAALLQKRLTGIQKMAMAGGLMAGMGVGLLATLKAPLDAARQYELAFTKFKTLNLGDVVNRQADQFARSANLMGVSSKELMNTLSESVGLFGSFSEAQKLAPKIAVLNKANSAIFQGKLEGIDEGSTRSLMKFIDRRGGTKDDASFMRNLDLAQRMVTGSGGFVKFRDLDQFSQMGGTAFRGLSDQGILNMSSLLQEQGGAKAGTSLMSLYQNLVAGRTPKKTMAILQDLGIGHLEMQTHGSVGGKPFKSLIMNDIKDSALLQSDPATWMRTVLLPAFASKGYTSQSDILKMTNDVLSNRTASNQASIMTTQIMQVLRDAKLAKNAMGYDDTINAYKKDPNSQFADLQAKYNGMLVNLGLVILPLVISALGKLTPMLQSMAEWIDKNRGLTKGLALGFIGLASAMAIGGAIMLATAAFSGLGLALSVGGVGLGAALFPVAGALLAIGAAVGGLAWLLNWAGGSDKPSENSRAYDPKKYGPKGLPPPTDAHAGSHWTRAGWVPDIPTSKGKNAPIHATIVMPNGKVLAEVVTHEQAKSSSRTQSGTTRFDGNMSRAPVGSY